MRTLLLCAAALGLTLTATAQTPFVVTDQAQANTGWGGASDTAPVGSTYTLGTLAADDFFIEKGAGAQLTHVDFYGGWTPSVPAMETFTVTVWTSAPLFSWMGPGVPVATVVDLSPTFLTPTSTSFNIYDPVTGAWNSALSHKITLVFPSPIDLPQGDYWLSIQATGSPSDFFSWEAGLADPNGNSGPYANYIQPDFVSWSVPVVIAYKDHAMTLNAITKGPSLSVDNLVSGGTVTLTVEDTAPFAPSFIAFSATGNGPITLPWGDLLLSPPFTILPLIGSDAAGTGTLNLSVPTGFAGASIWFHGLDLATFSFTNGVTTTIG